MAFGFLKKLAAVLCGKKPQQKKGGEKKQQRGGKGRGNGGAFAAVFVL